MVQTAAVTGWLDTESGEFFEDPVEREVENPTGDGEAYIHRATINRYLDKIDECMSDLNKALELGESHIDIYLSRGLIYAYNQNYELAEKDLDIFLANHQGIHKDKNQAFFK